MWKGKWEHEKDRRDTVGEVEMEMERHMACDKIERQKEGIKAAIHTGEASSEKRVARDKQNRI